MVDELTDLYDTLAKEYNVTLVNNTYLSDDIKLALEKAYQVGVETMYQMGRINNDR